MALRGYALWHTTPSVIITRRHQAKINLNQRSAATTHNNICPSCRSSRACLCEFQELSTDPTDSQARQLGVHEVRQLVD